MSLQAYLDICSSTINVGVLVSAPGSEELRVVAANVRDDGIRIYHLVAESGAKFRYVQGFDLRVID